MSRSENIEKWCGFFENEDAAQTDFDLKLSVLSLKKLIISATKKLQLDNGKKVLGKHLYKFTVVTCPKNLKENIDVE